MNAHSVPLCSELHVLPSSGVLLLWIEVGWIREFSVVVLGVECGLSCLGNLDEVLEVLLVGEVLVQVVLEVLKELHVLLHKVVPLILQK